jgi:hypothetical protein
MGGQYSLNTTRRTYNDFYDVTFLARSQSVRSDYGYMIHMVPLPRICPPKGKMRTTGFFLPSLMSNVHTDRRLASTLRYHPGQATARMEKSDVENNQEVKTGVS